MQQTLLVTVQGARRKRDVELPGDIPVGELLPLLLQMCGISETNPGRWAVSVFGTERVLQAKRTLFENRVRDGEILLVRRAEPAVSRREAPRQERVQETFAPRPRGESITITWEKPSLF
jgi:hypothetical protein